MSAGVAIGCYLVGVIGLMILAVAQGWKEEWTMHATFERFAAACARGVGSAYATAAAAALVLIWCVGGLIVGFTDTYQLVINTGTTIVTFLMVFVIQATQNRDTAEIKALLRELVEDIPEVDDARAIARIGTDE